MLMADLERTVARHGLDRGRARRGWPRPSASRSAEKQRLALLLEEKQKLQGETEAALADEQERSEELAAKAGSLKELIASLEKQAAQGARRSRGRGGRRSSRRGKRDAELAALPVPENNRLAAPRCRFRPCKASSRCPSPAGSSAASAATTVTAA